MVTMPSFIAKTVDKGARNKHDIPYVLYQTWHSKEMPKGMYDNIHSLLKSNPEFDYHLYSDNDCLQFIKDNFEQDVADAFEMLIPGAFKADLWRYCILYKKGGLYLDIKYYSTEPLYPIIEEAGPIFVLDSPETSCFDSKNGIYNGFMAVPPHSIILKMCIDDIVQSSKYKLLRKSGLDITGPCLLGRKLYSLNPDLVTHFQYQNYEETHNSRKIPMGYIKYKGRIILKHYIGYRADQKQIQKTPYYHELYKQKRVWKEDGTGTIYFILTASINNIDDPIRKEQYINGIQSLVKSTANIKNRKIIVVENNGKRPTYLDGMGVDVYYTSNNTLGLEKGTTELTDILNCIEHYKISDDDFIVKMTARYKVNDKSPFMDAVSVLHNQVDCILRYGNAWAGLDSTNKKDCITGLIGMRCKHVKRIKKNVVPIEEAWATESRTINPSRVIALDKLGVFICPASNTYYLV